MVVIDVVITGPLVINHELHNCAGQSCRQRHYFKLDNTCPPVVPRSTYSIPDKKASVSGH